MHRPILAASLIVLSGCNSQPDLVVVSPPIQAETTAICATTGRGARIHVTASNNSPRPMICQVACSFERPGGETGQVACDGAVAGNADAAPFCENIDRNRRVRRLTGTLVDSTFARGPG